MRRNTRSTSMLTQRFRTLSFGLVFRLCIGFESALNPKPQAAVGCADQTDGNETSGVRGRLAANVGTSKYSRRVWGSYANISRNPEG